MSARTDLLDDEGENRILRAFLIAYQNPSTTTGAMRSHLKMSGWDDCWPDWAAAAHKDAHLTKAGAQLWIRHLLALEGAAPTAPAPDTLRMDWVEMAASNGCLSMCFEIDGGVHVTLEGVGEEPEVYRNQDTIRAGIDKAIARARAQQENEKGVGK